MTTVKKHTDAMHARLGTIAQREQVLIGALSEALSHADQKLLDDVRSVTIEHESRRVVILGELHALAARIGAFPETDEQIEMLDGDALDLPYYAPAPEPVPVRQPGNVQQMPRGGDWRKATRNIANEYDHQLNATKTVHPAKPARPASRTG